MRFPGRTYQGKKGTYLAIYSHYPDICIAEPPSLEGKAKRLAHAQYSEGGKRKGINVFSLPSEEVLISEINLAGEISVKRVEGFDPKKTLLGIKGDFWNSVDKAHDIKYDLIREVRETGDEILNLIRADVFLYCFGKAAKNPQVKEENRIQYHDKIIPVTSLRTIEPERFLTPGKQEFVPSCLLEANKDEAQGCVTGWLPEQGASFDGKTFTNFFLSPWHECMYCYAQPKHKSFPKTVYKQDKQKLKEELLGDCRLTVGSDKILGSPVKVLRFGKRTESGSKYTLDSFVLTLETCSETGTRGVIPTKFLEYNPEIAELLKKTNSVVLYSIGFDELERGACKHGCNNQWRIEQAVKYKQAGVNTVLYLLTLAHAPPGKRETELLEIAKQNNLPVQLLPMRFSSKDLCKKVTEISWDDLKKSGKSLFGDENDQHWGTYEQLYSGMIIPEVIHQDWLDLIGDNSQQIRMCHHSSEKTWCGTCHLTKKGFSMQTQEVEMQRFGKTRFSKKKKGTYQLTFAKLQNGNSN